MRRADRLFRLIEALRKRKRAVTAETIARELEVSVRTVYRDVQDLVASGVPLSGEAGVGYVLGKGFDLPPVMFDTNELEALVLGVRMVQTYGDSALADAASRVLAKTRAVLPAPLAKRIDRMRTHAPNFHVSPDHAAPLGVLRNAIDQRKTVSFGYTDKSARETQRRAWPLGLFFWGPTWSLVGWCETRNDFRNFRLDRMRSVRTLDEIYPEQAGRTLGDFMRKVGAPDGAP